MTARRPFRCGFCSVRRHDRCAGAVDGGACGLLVCQCPDCPPRTERCVHCGATEDVEGWRCRRPGACTDRVIARRNRSPLWQQLQVCQQAGKAARAEVRVARGPQMTFEFGGTDE